MDWARARLILMLAFAGVNALLIFTLSAPGGVGSYNLAESLSAGQLQQLRETLSQRGVDLRAPLPRQSEPLPFLRVGYVATLENFEGGNEGSGKAVQPDPKRLLVGKFAGEQPYIDSQSYATIYPFSAKGTAAMALDLDNGATVQRMVEEFLRDNDLLPPGVSLLEAIPLPDNKMRLEYVPYFRGYPVYSGYLRVLVSERGVEQVSHFWVEPIGFREASVKPVRPPSEALLRLAGHLQYQQTGGRRVVTDMQLGYYAGPTLSGAQSVSANVNAWDTVPAWRILLDSGEVYYINAFNGELEF